MAELIQIHNPANAIGKPRIVFIHGLDGDIRTSWMSDPKDDVTLWPKWLGKDVMCPVWLLGYGAAASRWKADAMALPKLATSVLESLATEPELTTGPLVLVGHSLGGLVIKTALELGMGRDVDRHKQLVKNIKGIVFVGTPHFGSRLASIASSLRLFRANPQIRDLALDDARLEVLNQLFVKLQMEMGIKVRVYSETRPLRPKGIWRWLPIGATVVSPSSAQPHIPGEAGTPVEADHLSISKPSSRTSGIYPSVKAFLGEVEAAVARETPIEARGSRSPPSDSFEALAAEERASEIVHLAFATHGYVANGNSGVPVCGSLCLTSDDPDRLRQTLTKVRESIATDPLEP
jgi:pimeloyl-ACP methyl ester carboxylesterase